MSVAKLGFLAILATMLAHAPVAANSLGGTNRVSAFHPNREILWPLQSREPEHLGVGKILVASRHLGDPNFAETVILLVQYDAGGVVGLILNRRTKLPISRALEDIKAAKNLSDPVYFGGPVDAQQVRALRKSPAKLEKARHICDGVYEISTKALLEQTISDRADPSAFHVYLGYAGWHVDQLQRELELGAWFIFPADAEIIFNSDPGSLWRQLIHKTELKLARNNSADNYDSSGAPF
jgi:putative transcriptional regulator